MTVVPVVEEDRDPLVGHAAAMVGVAVAGIALAWLVPAEAQGRFAAFIGVGAAAFSGAVALPLKRKAMQRSLQDGLKVLGAVFFVRLALVAGGLLFVMKRGAGPIPFVVGFFGVYFALQWIEISYILSENKRRGTRG